MHADTIVNVGGINNATLGTRAPQFLSSAWQWPLAQHGFLERTIPSRYRLWVTEMGGAYNSGRPGVTDAFPAVFWFADALPNF